MNLLIVHYHLNRGGVTRVIQAHLDALESQLAGHTDAVDLLAGEDARGPKRLGCQKQKKRPVSGAGRPMGQGLTEQILVVLLYGGRQEGWPEDFPSRFSTLQVILEPVPLLDYDQVHGRTGPAAEKALYQQLVEVLHRHGCRPEQTIFHVHNHSLGKNVLLPGVLARLAKDGYPMLLQIHDFAEDFRPANYRGLLHWQRQRTNRTEPGGEADGSMGWLYPQAEHLHYAVLNSRDRQVLLLAGASAERLHLLPNPVVGPEALPPVAEAKARLEELFGIPAKDRYLLYPVRAIRRKNLGEAVLCSLLAGPGVWIGLTLAPLNPVERRQYQRWKQWTAQRRLRCVWETGETGGLRLAENLAAANALLTTSIAEGFGMVFLESWLVGRPLLGRNLPEITGDFERLGLRLPGMWHRLAVPLDWLGEQRVRQRLLAAYQQVLADYQHPIQPDWAEALDEKLADCTVDFGDLDEAFQQEVLQKILCDHGAVPSPRVQILEKNAGLAGVLSAREEDQEKLLRQNAQVVGEHFSPHRLGQQLWEIYQRLAQARRTGPVEKLSQPERILAAFLDLRRFRLLRT